MKCPHCQTAFHQNPDIASLGRDEDGYWGAITNVCPTCKRLVIEIMCANRTVAPGFDFKPSNIKKYILGYPKAPTRPLPSSEVPKVFADDYIEAALVLTDSPKASAALGRRCLQNILREKAEIKQSDLAKEIEEVISKKLLPTHLSEAIDAVRNIGNFAAHPIKSTSTGEIVPVEPGEAEWILEVLEGLFDFFFIQPERFKKRRAVLDEKLASAGKPPIKRAVPE